MQRIIPFGQRAILIEFDQKIDPFVNQKVHQLNAVIMQANLPSLSYTVPAYCSLTLVFEIKIEKPSMLIEKIRSLNEDISLDQKKASVLKKIPVCYDALFALDQEDIIQKLGISWEEVIELHTSQEYLVYMLGFTPGFGFMGKVLPALQIKRKQIPRTKVPMGSVGLANEQTGIYDLANQYRFVFVFSIFTSWSYIFLNMAEQSQNICIFFY